MSPGVIKTRRSLWRAVKYYAYGCFAKSWNAAISGVYAFVGQAVGTALDPAHFEAPSWRTIAFTFSVVFCVQALGYFKDHPIPETLEESNPPFPMAPTTTTTTTTTTQ